jgi:type I restriction enzyme S subunit
MHGLVQGVGFGTTELTVLRPGRSAASNFLNYSVQTNMFRSHGEGAMTGAGGLKRVPEEFTRNFPIAVPSVADQKIITTHLDRETTRIDALIAKKTRFIELLKEKRQALITQAVTKGLDPNVKMKDSGVEWLGEVPEHWAVMQLQYVVAKIEQGWSPECLGEPAQGNEWGVVKSGCVNGGVFSPVENKKLPDGFKPRPDISIRTGDILMSRASGSVELIGSIGLVEEFEGNLMLSDKIFRINLNSNVHKLFFMILMTSRLIRNQIEMAISGAEGLANNLPQARIRKFWFALPPQEEQTLISDHVKAQTKRLEALMAKSDRSITLLKERRSALITAAVTGQIDLREAA